MANRNILTTILTYHPKATPLNDKISQEEINSILRRACDTFRGTVDPAEYKNYILVMLFLKYISDVWHDHYARPGPARLTDRREKLNVFEFA